MFYSKTTIKETKDGYTSEILESHFYVTKQGYSCPEHPVLLNNSGICERLDNMGVLTYCFVYHNIPMNIKI